MGVLRAGFNGTVGQPSAQVIDGSLNFFQESNPYLEFTPGSDGNRSTWTISFWAKVNPNETGTYNPFTLSTSDSFAWEYEGLMYAGNTLYYIDYISQASGSNILWRTNAKFRDTEWYHFMAVKVDNSTFKLYVNGEEQTSLSSSTNNGNQSSHWNKSGQKMFLGGSAHSTGYSSHSPGMSQFYFIDGQALAPADFAFTDPLTNTWKPKKYTGTFTGTNTCYLPFDGNSPIGIDKSGNGNDWTPVNFGGSVELDKATGARPIMNTTQGGTKAGVGVFGSKENKYYTVTTANGSVYQFDITSGDNPSLEFIRGATYRFDYSSYSSHPVLFSSSNPDSSTTAYTTGTSIASNVISFTVPHDAPDTLYYYCSNHPTGMNGAISITTDNTKADQFASNCVLAMPLVGVDDDVSASIACTSTTKTITSNGSAAASSSSSNFYSGSFLFDGTDDALTSSSCGSGATKYTMECWFNTDGFSQAQRPINMSQDLGGNRYLYAEVRTDKTLQIREESTGSAVSANAVFAADKWHHVAVSYDGVRLRGFVDGVFVVQTSANGSPVPLGTDMKMRVGADESNTGSNEFDGHIQDVRVYFGACKYTATNIGEQAFVVPATSPDILPDTPSGVSGGSKLTKITDGAGSFDGTNDSLSVADHADFTFGSGDFTMEAFVYNKSSSYRSIVMKYGGSAAASSWFWSMYNGQNQFYYYSGSNEPAVTSGKTHYNKWVHCAVSREGNTIRIFDDGELTGTLDVSSYATMNDSTVPLDIGADYADNYDMDGFISNVRIVKGTALYTKSFTPPTAPLTNVTNTKLLCCQSNLTSGAAAVSPNISGSLNNGRVWSSLVSGPTRKEDRVANAFNGSTSSPGAIPAYPGTLTFAPGLTSISSVKIYGYYAGSGVTLHVNGSAQSPSAGAFTLTISTSTLDSVVWTATDGFNYMRIDAIEVDSTVLIDPVVGPDDSNEAATTFNPFITDINTVRGQETAYPTLNPLDMRASTVLSNGNLTVTGAGAAWYLARSTQFLTTGKYYWEYKWGGSVVDGSNGYQMGLKTPTSTLTAAAEQAGSYAFQYTSIYLTAGSLNTVVISPGSITPGDCVMFAYDADAGLMWFGVNGKWNDGANPATGSNSDWTSLPTTGLAPFAGVYGTAIKIDINFGQKPFKYAPPDGFQPINDANVRPETVIARPDQFVGLTTYTGNGSARSINVGLEPDLVWIKSRSGAYVHYLVDTVRGAQKRLSSDSTNAEATNAQSLTTFNIDGFSLGNEQAVNENTDTFVSWCWKAGGNKNTFNVDDVGYASASDVNMAVGDLNSVTFDKSQTWSGQVSGTQDGTYPFTNMFNADGEATHSYPANGTTATFTPSPSFSNAKTVKVWYYGPTINANTFKLNGVNVGDQMPTTSGTLTKTFNVDGFTSWSWSKGVGGDGAGMLRIDVDGVQLVDSGVTTPDAPSIANAGASVGTKQGFSIIKFTNTSSNSTQSHGLTQKPDFIIWKKTSGTSHWPIYHSSLGATKYMYLNLTNAAATGSEFWNNTEPTDSLVTTKGEPNSMGSAGDTIMYLWHDVPGLQKFGSYSGNSNADGVFVECGFRPAILMIKNTGTTTNWVIVDSKRDTFNPLTQKLYADYAGVENVSNPAGDGAAYNNIDFVSNGFKLRSNNSWTNTGYSYIYMAWAEAPTVNLYGGGASAR